MAIGGWPMDDASARRASTAPTCRRTPCCQPPEVYNIPLRSLYSQNIGNLLMAGRNISASYVAFTSTRVMATCAVDGAGGRDRGGAVRRRRASLPRQLAGDAEQIARLQQTLLRDDQTIKGRRNQDPADLARTGDA